MASTASGMPSSSQEALKKLRMDDRMADVVLVCNGVEVKAHRLILSIRSIYFQKMFTSNFKESQTDHVNFPNIDDDVMHSILDFVYYDSNEKITKENLNHVIRVHQWSHLFEIQGLTNRCWELIMTSLQIDNILDIWNTVLVYGDETERAIILEFVLKNLEAVIKKDKFVAVHFTGFKLLMEEIKEDNIALTDTILAGIIRWYKSNPGQHFDTEGFLAHLNYDYVSKDYMKQLLENEQSLFTKKFYKQFCISHCKDETKKAKLNAVMMERKYKLPLNFFRFHCYVKVVNDYPLNEKVSLIKTDLHDKGNDEIISEQLPFLIKDDFIPIQVGCNLYIIGAVPLTYPEECQTNHFIVYNLENNSSSIMSSIPIPITESACWAVIGQQIYIVECDWDELPIYSYNIPRNKWTTNTVQIEDRMVVGCLNLKETLYLLCRIYKSNYSLYKFTGGKMIRVCNVPIQLYSIYEPHETVVVHDDKLFVFSWASKSDYSAYAIFNPDNLHWKVNKLTYDELIPNPFVVFSNPYDSIYFHSSSTNKLYIFLEINDTTGTIKEFMDVEESLSNDERLVARGYKKVTKLIFFQSGLQILPGKYS